MEQIKNKIEIWIQNQNAMHVSIAKEIGLMILDELFPTIIGIDWFGELWQYREIVVANTIGQNALNLTMLSNVFFIYLVQIVRRKSHRMCKVSIQKLDTTKNVSFFTLNQWMDQDAFKIEIMFTKLLKFSKHNPPLEDINKGGVSTIDYKNKIQIIQKWADQNELIIS